MIGIELLKKVQMQNAQELKAAGLSFSIQFYSLARTQSSSDIPCCLEQSVRQLSPVFHKSAGS
jgi:hypothetical protein